VEKRINSEELVPYELKIIAEREKIQAYGNLLIASDLCGEESLLTGEAVGVWTCIDDNNSDDYWRRDYCYAGTLVTQGRGIVRVDKIGKDTEYGKIGINISEAPDTPTPLQKQTGKLVKICATIAAVLFVLVCIITYFNLPDHSLKERVIESILSGITLAMAMIPEEFPVILTVFLSMGAW
ncbi:P-type ATPase, partial [Clostridium butyricum]